MSGSMRLLRLLALLGILLPLVQVLRMPLGLAYSSGTEGRGSVTVKVATANQIPARGSGQIPPIDELWTDLCNLNPQELNDPGAQPSSNVEAWYQLACSAYELTNDVSALLAGINATANSARTSPLQEAKSAESTIVLPAPTIETNPNGTTVVNLPTWFWIDPDIWHVWTATASVGTLSATAIATPLLVTYDLGNGSRLTCDGPGVRYDLAQSVATQDSSCAYVYPRTSVAGESSVNDQGNPYYVITATVTWRVDWVSNGSNGGTLPSLTTSSSTDLRVQQIQAVDEW
jgi:hypothetical protein